MRRLGMVLSVVLCAGFAWAEDKIQDVYWSKLKAEGKLSAGVVVEAAKAGDMEYLEVANQKEGAATVTVLTIENPQVTASKYSVRGKVRWQDVEGKGYLEMWSCFAGDSRFFTRTLADSGPMGYLEGTGDWRFFSLPFTVSNGSVHPEKLVVNVVLPGKGTVHLSPLRLAQYAEKENPLTVPGSWWTDSQGGMIGGIGGSALGLLGAVIGVLGGRGKGRGFVLGTLKVLPVIGLICLTVGVVALVRSQPYAVYYPMLLLGGLLVILPLSIMRVARKRYQEIELRKMEAADTP